MTRIITAFALATIALTASACDPVADIESRITAPSDDDLDADLDLAGYHETTLPAELPNDKH